MREALHLCSCGRGRLWLGLQCVLSLRCQEALAWDEASACVCGLARTSFILRPLGHDGGLFPRGQSAEVGSDLVRGVGRV